ncbi:hypothetical protein JKF63_03590 [Porcisia hertigi]|uniref:Uncharacterized protein n=1 Tax=Porcisia hertigi TaxID=2761500 RepID=A0A836L6B6_9TRYP|nr:hypothetical protein JKF63_03590 [Porcisia hertigi]
MHRHSAGVPACLRCGLSTMRLSFAVSPSSIAKDVLPASFMFLPSPSLMTTRSGLQYALRHCSTKPPPSSSPCSSSMASSVSHGSGDVLNYAPWEVRALVLPLLPKEAPNTEDGAAGPAVKRGHQSWPTQVQQQLPRALRQFLERESCSKSRTNTSQLSEGSGPHGAQCALTQYMLRHFPEDVVLLPSGHLAVRLPRDPVAPRQASASGLGSAPTNADVPVPRDTAAMPSPASAATLIDVSKTLELSAASPAQQAAAPNTALPPPPLSPRTSTSKPRSSSNTSAIRTDSMTPPPPPVPQGNSWRYNNGGTLAMVPGGGLMPPRISFGGAGASDTSLDPTSAGSSQVGEPPSGAPPPLRSTLQVMDALVQYIPTFFISIDAIEPTLPSEIQQLYADISLRFYLKRFRHYIDTRATHGSVEVRLRADFDHPQRGYADARFAVGGFGSVGGAQSLRRPPRNSEANLVGLVAPQVPKEYTSLADVLQEIAPIISRHPAFDPRLGVTGLLGKYPEYFQMAQGKLRARPYRVAPNSLDDHDAATSPLPSIFAKVLAVVDEAAVGKNYGVEEEKKAAAVSTGRLYSLLTQAEKVQVKNQCRSFPTFLRLHGKEIVVSIDKMKVYKFLPEYEACVDTLMDERLRSYSLRPDDPVLKIPVEMAPETNADWAVRELYDALPLMQCAELDEVLSLVPPAVRDALPQDLAAVQAVLDQYPEYFTTWPYPDDPSIIVVQRAKVDQPNFEKTEIVRMVLPLIPQGGTTIASLRTRVPLALQRYFSRHGTLATLRSMKEVFAIAGDRIVRLV